MNSLRKSLYTASFLWTLAVSAFAAPADLAQARKLLDEGKPKEAYALLAPHEYEMAGNRDYDYLLGVSALDGGVPDKATLALERVLALDPNAAGARLDMARAYYALGSFERARQELVIVSGQNPPPAARLVIDRYMAAIEAQEKARQTQVTGYLEAAVGYDNNITSVVSDFTNAVLATYNLAGFRPTGSSIMRSSPVAAVGSGVDVQHQVDKQLGLYAGVDYRKRSVMRAHPYDSQQLDLRAGASHTRNKDFYRLGLTVQQFTQQTDLPSADRSAWGVSGEWRRTVSDRDQGSLFTSVSRQRYPDIPVNDVNSIIVGGGWLHLYSGPRKPLVYASLFGGYDRALNRLANGSDNTRRSIGMRVYAQMSVAESVDLFANTGLLRREDLSANARSTLVNHGRDAIWDLSLGVNWRPAQNWIVRPQVTYSTNRSNVALSEFRRTEGSVTVRYEFR